MSTRQLIAKVWSLCGILRDGGITYQDYLTELSWLLYLQLSSQHNSEVRDERVINVWPRIIHTPASQVLDVYQEQLRILAKSSDSFTSQIYMDARSRITDTNVLAALVREINKIDWQEQNTQALGDIYEGILERNALEQKSGAGQYFTPRIVVDLMVQAISPQPGELVQDPAAGTGGFLVAAANHVKRVGLQNSHESGSGISRFQGVELVPGAFRLCLMNLALHAVPATVLLGNTLSPLGAELERPDVILTNPPFGSRRGADTIDRVDLTFPTSNKQLAFLQHAYRTLKNGGRAAIVVPDGVLFEPGARGMRQELLRTCDVHTMLRLPVGLFYAQGVKTNVLFFDKASSSPASDATSQTWVYDARTHLSARTQAPKAAAIFADFTRIYHLRSAERAQVAKTHPRFASFTREQIYGNGDRLDLTVTPANDGQNVQLMPDDSVKAVSDLRTALREALTLADQIESLLMKDESADE
jgi:type I restriction enzyme M protein